MNNSQIFNSKDNFVKNLNASNEAKRLEQKVIAYNNSQKTKVDGNNTEDRINSSRRINRPQNSMALNKAASAGLQASGVPQPVADKLVNSKLGQNVLSKAKGQNKALGLLDGLLGGKKNKADENSFGKAVFELPVRVIKWTLIAMGPVSVIIVFCCLFITASQIYLNSVKLGQADSISDADVEKAINKKTEDDLNHEITDDNVAFTLEIQDEKSLKFINSKLETSNLVKTAGKRRKYNEADLEKLEDFYPAVVDISKNYDERMVYDFFFKMYNLYTTYKEEYNVEIDLPLLMATLNVQTDDMYELFSSNLSDEDRKDKKRTDMSDFKYDKDWSNYVTTSKTSTHDMEILVQNMFSNSAKETCVDASGKITKENTIRDEEIGTVVLVCGEGETYNVTTAKFQRDYEKYDEFLKQFIEKKYYLDEDKPLDVKPKPIESGGGGGTSTEVKPKPSTGEWRTWKQCGNNSWSKKIVPTSNLTMCDIGCLVTSLTMQIVRSGTETTISPLNPGESLKKFKFMKGGYFLWGSISNLAPNFVELTKVYFTGMSNANKVELLKKYDKSGYYIVLSVTASRIPSHFVVLDYIDYETGDVYIVDPGGNNNPNLFQVYNLKYAVIYEKKD